MALYTTLTTLSQTAGANPPDGASDAPSTIPTDLRLLGSFSALLRDGAHVYANTIAGTNTITGTIATNPTSYVVGQAYRFVAAGANTGAVTLNFNNIGAQALLKTGNVALTGGELQATAVYEVAWDGVNFQLVGMYGFKNSLGNSGYQYLPSGLILQWGSLGVTSGTAGVAGQANGTFPIAFPSQCLFMFGYHNSADSTYLNCNASPSSVSAYQVSLISGVSNLARTVYWIALGK